MRILGIHDGHDAGAVLIDGKAVKAVSEERFTRVKLQRGFPLRSVEYLLHGNAEVDYVAIAGLFRRKRRLENLDMHLSHLIGEDWRRRAIFVEHHVAHAASAYLTSGYGEAVVLSLDAAGDGLSSSLFVARGPEMVRVGSSTYIDSVGDFYASVTELLGFTPMKDEGKVMSLAAYGRPLYDLSAAMEVMYPSFRNRLGTVGREATEVLSRLLSFSAEPQDVEAMKRGEVLRRYADIAASAQRHLERMLEEYGLRLRNEYGLPLAYAGGVAQNVRANFVLLRTLGSLWVHPHMGDGGLAMGAALYLKASFDALDGKWRPWRMPHVYLGPDPGDIQRGEEADPGMVAELLAEGEIVAVCRGPMEYGPRALGNRSILADPRAPDVVGRLNAMLDRDAFQPFAPSVLEGYGPSCFLDYAENRFMTVSFPAGEEFAEAAPAVVHVDGTSRPQEVGVENPFFREVIRRFHRETGVPAVLNTSLNIHGEPIALSSRDALITARRAGIRHLVLNDRMVAL